MSKEQAQTAPASLTEEDLSKLGLREHPFIEHANHSYLYSDSQLEMTSNIIMEYLANPTTTIVLTGEDGVGKTTFLRKVLRLGHQQYLFFTLRVNNETNFEFIEDKIKQRWVLPDRNEHSLAADLSIENYVITYLRKYTHAAIIIDDAHFLSSSTLDKLLALKHRISLAYPLSLGLILAGENTLKLAITELEDSNPACTQVYQINVRPFTRVQTGHYIEHRLQAAGLEGKILLDETDFTEIHKATLGNIRQIHERAILALQNQCRESSLESVLNPHITTRNPKLKAPIFLVSVLAFIGIGFYIAQRTANNGVEEAIIPLEGPLTSEPTLPSITPGSDKPPSKQTPSLPLPNVSSDKPAATDIKAPKIAAIKERQEEVSLLSESIEVPDEKQLKEKLIEKTQVATKSDTIETKKTVIISELINDEPASISQSVPETYGKAWLKSLDPTSYTLQVVATKKTKQFESLLKKENLKDNYAYFDKPIKEATFHVLVIGNYKTRDDALATVDQLSSNLRKNNPWPVPLKNIQSFLN